VINSTFNKTHSKYPQRLSLVYVGLKIKLESQTAGYCVTFIADVVYSTLHFNEVHIEVRKTNLTLHTFIYDSFKLHHCMTRIPLTHLQQ
jgi:hypothetical protein